MSVSRKLCAVASAAAAAVSIAAPASAANVFVDHFHDVGSEEFTDVCGFDTATHTFDVQGTSRGKLRDGQVFIHDTIHGTESFINPDTGKAYTHVFNDVSKDESITDNGDGTITVEIHAAGSDKWFGPGGTPRFLDTGTVVFAFHIDLNGTPDDPEDDIFEFLGDVKPSTGRNDLANHPDFCEDFLAITG
jgi:hypothetical protein